MRSTRWCAVDNEPPRGIIDGTNATFTLAFTPIAGSVHVYKRGLRMRPGADHDCTISGRTITFNVGAVPQPGDNLVADYRISPDAESDPLEAPATDPAQHR